METVDPPYPAVAQCGPEVGDPYSYRDFSYFGVNPIGSCAFQMRPIRMIFILFSMITW